MPEEAKTVEVRIEHRDLGEIGYTAYRDQTGGVSLVSGQPIPEWAALPDAIREAWQAAGVKIALVVARRMQDALAHTLGEQEGGAR
jgi:hypothetical protein